MSRAQRRLAAACAFALGLCAACTHGQGGAVVTIYSADGLRDGKPNWFDTEFAAFTRQTGIKVQYIEAGSGVIVNRILAERADPQADVLVTLPPFMQKAAAAGVLQAAKLRAATGESAGGAGAAVPWFTLANDYACWIYNANALPAPPPSYDALLDVRFKNRIQYSTPGQAGDGTAVMLQSFKMYGGKERGFGYLHKLQANNLGPSASTGRLAALVNKGELWLANGDLQMNYVQLRRNPNIRIFFPQAPDGKRYAMALPYEIALVKGGPHGEPGRKLIAFLLSRPAQEKLFALAGSFPARSDVPATDAAARTLTHMLAGVQIWVPDWDQVTRDLDADVERWHQVTGS